MVGNVRCFHAAICSVCCYFCSAFVNVPGPSQCPADHVHRIVAQLPPVAIPELFLELCQHANEKGIQEEHSNATKLEEVTSGKRAIGTGTTH